MKTRFWVLMIIIAAALAFWPGGAQAVIYMDEDFEGETIFTDRGFPVRNDYEMPTSTSLVKGLNLRCWDSTYASPRVDLGTREGTVVPDRAYKGSKSYRLAPGKKLAVTPGQFSGRNLDWFHVWQFAVSVDAASAAKPAGTQIGHFKVNYDRDSTSSLVPDLSVVLQLVVNESGKVDLVCTNSQEKIGSLSGAANDWLLVTMIACDSITDEGEDVPTQWHAFDPLTGQRKGPRSGVGYYPMPTGFNIYVNSSLTTKTTTVWLSRDPYLGFMWGNELLGKKTTSEIGWEFEASANGTMYLDNVVWHAGINSDAEPFGQESAARMSQFAEDVVIPASPLDLPDTFISSALGSCMAKVPDTNGDGVEDVVIGAPHHVMKKNGYYYWDIGAAYVFDGKTGQALATLAPPDNFFYHERFGYSVCGIPDVNGDGRGDVVVGVPDSYGPDINVRLRRSCGEVYIFSGADGSMLRRLLSANPRETGRFGYSVSSVADVNGNGIQDVAVGAPGEVVEEPGKVGRTYIFEGGTGELLKTIDSPNP